MSVSFRSLFIRVIVILKYIHVCLLQVLFSKTAEYLKRALETTGRRPYTVAIASYALALLGKDHNYNPTQSLLSAAAPGSSYTHTLHLYIMKDPTFGEIPLRA